MVAGNPARIVKKLRLPGEMREELGEEEYQKYLDAYFRAVSEGELKLESEAKESDGDSTEKQ